MTPTATERATFERLDEVARIRGRFHRPFVELAQDWLRALPTEGPVLELGAGDGQFSAVLHPALGERLTVSEPTDEGLRRLAEKLPPIHRLQAPAESLPVTNDSLGAIVGCCVLDVVSDLRASLAEARRVLRPGGVLLHVLDLSTDLRALFSTLRDDGTSIPLPNVVTDPLASEWPEDVLIVKRNEFTELARRVDAFAEYVTAFDDSTDFAVATFDRIQGQRAGREEFAEAFREARSSQRPSTDTEFQGKLLSSAFVFHSLLVEQATRQGFQIESAGLETCSLACDEPVDSVCRVGFLRSQPGKGSRTLTAAVLRARVPVSIGKQELLPPE